MVGVGAGWPLHCGVLPRPFGPIFQFLGNPIIIEFLFGVAIARAPKLDVGIPAIFVGAALLLVAAVLGLAPVGGTLDFLRGDDNLRRVFVCGIPAAIIVYGTMQITAAPSVWTYLGDASYALYLVHTFMVTPLQALWTKLPNSSRRNHCDQFDHIGTFPGASTNWWKSQC